MSVQKFDHPSDKRLITGVSGTGKTTLFAKLLKAEKARWKFVYDHQGEFSTRFGALPIRDIETLCQKTAYGGYIVFDPVALFPGKSADGFRFFCDYVFSVSETLKGRKMFCCDELQKLTSNTEEPAELMAILETGRRYQLDCLFISQSPNRIHNGIRNQLTEVYTFRQSDERALIYLEQNGFPAEQVRNLERFKYLWRNLETGEQNFANNRERSTGSVDQAGDAGGKVRTDAPANTNDRAEGRGANLEVNRPHSGDEPKNG